MPYIPDEEWEAMKQQVSDLANKKITMNDLPKQDFIEWLEQDVKQFAPKDILKKQSLDAPQIKTDAVIPRTIATDDTPWITVQPAGSVDSRPLFKNAWVNFGGNYAPAGFYKDPWGYVHLRGTIKTGAATTVAFTLPPGYRPEFEKNFACDNAGGYGMVIVAANGDVTGYVGNVALSLNNINFRAKEIA